MSYRAFFSIACLVAVCLGAAQPLAAAQAEGPVAAAPAAGKILPMKEFMAHVVAYSAQNVWNKQGWINDKSGERSLFPRNDQEWEDAESASLTLSEVIGILSQPGRQMNVPGWDSNVLLVRKLAIQAAAAAEGHDAKAFMVIGGEIDEACESCHRAAGLVK